MATEDISRKDCKLEVVQVSTPFISLFGINVNAYIVKADEDRFYLIDTGMPTQRAKVVKALEESGCRKGQLKLIMLTHGDKDHVGNAKAIAEKFDSRIAMNEKDAGMIAKGDMFVGRHRPSFLMYHVMNYFFGVQDKDRFVPDINLYEGQDLWKDYSFPGRVSAFPGHSSGSVGILTDNGDLFCGDLLSKTGKKPEVWSIIDDKDASAQSVEKLSRLNITIVYPGHGSPFLMSEFKADRS